MCCYILMHCGEIQLKNLSDLTSLFHQARVISSCMHQIGFLMHASDWLSIVPIHPSSLAIIRWLQEWTFWSKIRGGGGGGGGGLLFKEFHDNLESLGHHTLMYVQTCRGMA